MVAKIFFLCASALLVQTALAQCGCNSVAAKPISLGNGCNNLGNIGLGLPLGLNNGFIGSGLNGLTFNVADLASIGSSGSFPIGTISPFGPSGIAVESDVGLGGLLNVEGTLPYLSAVAFEGVLPTAGSGIASAGCGSGVVGITGEGYSAPAFAPAAYPGLGFGSIAAPAAYPGLGIGSIAPSVYPGLGFGIGGCNL